MKTGRLWVIMATCLVVSALIFAGHAGAQDKGSVISGNDMDFHLDITGNVGTGTGGLDIPFHIERIMGGNKALQELQNNGPPIDVLANTIVDGDKAGICKTGPAYKLDIADDIDFKGRSLRNRLDGTLNRGRGFVDAGSGGNLYTLSNKVGIGTPAPKASLHIRDGVAETKVGTFDFAGIPAVGLRASNRTNSINMVINDHAGGLVSNKGLIIGSVSDDSSGFNGLFTFPGGDGSGPKDDLVSLASAENVAIEIFGPANPGRANKIYYTAQKHMFRPAGGAPGQNYVVINQNGALGIGELDPGSYKLNVKGDIRADEIVVRFTGADFVFNDNYRLRPLKEVEEYISENRHLPDIPSAEEVKARGAGLGEMQARLLQKVEELTLYVIAQNKRIERLEKENESLKRPGFGLED